LPVIQAAAGERLLAPLACLEHSRQQLVDRVHRPWVIDAVGRYKRRVERAGTRYVECLEEEAVLRRIATPAEHTIPPEVLCADIRLAVIGADFDGGASSADLRARVSRLVGEGIGGAVRTALIQPQSEATRIRPGRLDEARFVDEPEVLEAIVASVTIEVPRTI